MKRILVIEDNRDLAFGLRNNLEIEGYEVETAANGRTGMTAFSRMKPDLLILDLMMPEMDGFRVLRSLRQEGHTTPILVLTARGEEADKVRGLRIGADDYVTKPFGLLELLARVEALLRRAHAGQGPGDAIGVQRFGAIEVDPSARTVHRFAQSVELAPKEFDLLLALLRARGAVVPRLQLLKEVWGPAHVEDSHYLRIYMAQLRHKLEADPAQPRFLLTEVGVGYRLAME